MVGLWSTYNFNFRKPCTERHLGFVMLLDVIDTAFWKIPLTGVVYLAQVQNLQVLGQETIEKPEKNGLDLDLWLSISFVFNLQSRACSAIVYSSSLKRIVYSSSLKRYSSPHHSQLVFMSSKMAWGLSNSNISKCL